MTRSRSSWDARSSAGGIPSSPRPSGDTSPVMDTLQGCDRSPGSRAVSQPPGRRYLKIVSDLS
jgi:hypothetical protein